ncbi:hypothetical protein PanWU01x14_033880 [Parasponia andersonii]|uniref:Uncharacterized protein n=1 Tax=Parasponia andersonii TaxID=3476 RepID=A0A2P5DTT8_PARAD|nr:hypothetical protein PanWU01x14_033880 [Parasponia andersonii]
MGPGLSDLGQSHESALKLPNLIIFALKSFVGDNFILTHLIRYSSTGNGYKVNNTCERIIIQTEDPGLRDIIKP